VIPGSVSSGILTRVRTSSVRSRVRIRRPDALAGSLRQAFRRSGLLLGPSDFCNKETMARARRGISEALASRLRRVLYGASGIFSISLRPRKREEALLDRSIPNRLTPRRIDPLDHAIPRRRFHDARLTPIPNSEPRLSPRVDVIACHRTLDRCVNTSMSRSPRITLVNRDLTRLSHP
jgi:hypothetical protein